MSDATILGTNGYVSIWLGNALRLPTDINADLVLCDPPYSRAGGLHSGRRATEGRQEDLAGADQFWGHWFADAWRSIAATSKPGACGLIFCDYRTVSAMERAILASGTGWTLTQCCVWDRECIGLGSPFRASHEMIAFVRGPDFKWDGRRDLRNVFRCRWPYGQHKYHPAEKPTQLLRDLIEIACPKDGIVLDPFAGSGSTLVAAVEAGRRAYGFELDEGYADIARGRLMSAALKAADRATEVQGDLLEQVPQS